MRKLSPTLVNLFVVLSFLMCACGSGEEGTQVNKTNESLAYEYAKEFVKDNLKSPSTAKFPNIFDRREHITKVNDNEYLIESWVDSQNAFGATIRSNFSCKILFDDDEVKLEDLEIK